MSATQGPPHSVSQRYSIGIGGRSLAVPRSMLVMLGIGALVAAGMGVNAVVQHFVNPAPVGPDPSPANQIRVSAPAPFVMPQDTTAPDRAPKVTPPPNTANQAPPPAAKPTAARAMADAATSAVTGEGGSRSILMAPDKEWLAIGTSTVSQAAPVNQSTPADLAAVAFGKKPKPTQLEGSKATAVHDLTRTIRPGTRLFCTTQEAIDTTTGAGDFVCKTDQWVQAWDGVTPLIPPNSWILVHYEELKNGANRIHAASGVLTTPDGVVTSLGDPFGMPDGSPGVEGVVEDKTWPRLKEGLILDFAQSAFQTVENLASRQNQGSGNSSFNFNMNTNNTQQMVERALEKNMQIRDVLRLPEGAHLSMTIRGPVFLQDVVSFTMRANAR